MPSPSPAVDRFQRLHRVTDAVVRLFGAGDWTLERGRAVDSALRALLLARVGDRPGEDDDAVAALLEQLKATDLFDPAVVADRGPFVERMLSLRDRAMLDAASAQPDWRPQAWEASGDDTELAATEDERASERRFAGVLSRAFTRLYRSSLTLDDHTIVSVTDRRGTIVEVNEEFCRISGYERNELLGATHSIVKSGRHPRAFYRALWSTIAAGRIWTGEICNRRKDGSYYWLRSTIIPVLDTAGSPEEYVSVRTEITADKWSQERLELLEHAVSADSCGVVVADALQAELPIAYANPAFERLFARDGDEIRGVSLRELLGTGQSAEHFDALVALLDSDVGASMLLRGARDDGSNRAFALQLSPVLHAGIRTHVVGVVSDATELEAIRAELSDRNQRLRLGEKGASFGTWESDIGEAASRRLRWSESTASILGLPAIETDTSYEHFLSVVHPHDRQRVVDSVDESLRRGKRYDIEHRCVRPDGTTIWVHEQGCVVRDERGRPARMLGMMQDITERKQLAAQLQNERERLARTQALARLGDWRIDDASGETSWSASLYEIYQRDPSSFRPRADTFARAADLRDGGLLAAAIEAARDGRDADCLHRIALPDGARRWVRLRAHRELDELGGVVALVGTAQDVTDALHNEDCARLLRRVLATSEDAIAIADRYGELVHANASWRRALGYVAGERPRGALLAACESPAREALERAIQRRDPAFRHRTDLSMRRLDGAGFVARGEIGVSHDARGDVQFFVHRFRDASGELAHERALADLCAQREHAAEAACRLLGQASEALRAPSQAVLAFAQLSATRPELSDVARQYLHHVVDAGRRMLHVVGDHLDLARAEAGRLSLRIEPLALDDVFEALSEGGGDYGAGMPRLAIGHGERLAVRGDRLRLVQALRALLAGAPQARLDVQRASGACGELRDTAAIRITRAGGEATPQARALAGLLLAQMGATIDEEPPQASGRSCAPADVAALVVCLPSASLDDIGAAMADGDAPRTEVEPPAGGAVGARRRSVLHVDDDLAGLSLLQEAFRDDSRVRVRVSPSALLGIELAHSERPDAVLLDVDSDALDAFAVLRELRVDPRTRDVPVIAITADVSESNRRRIDACGFFRFVEKPLSLPELLRTIDAAFAATRRGR